VNSLKKRNGLCKKSRTCFQSNSEGQRDATSEVNGQWLGGWMGDVGGWVRWGGAAVYLTVLPSANDLLNTS
jgi:hypothetical protein